MEVLLQHPYQRFVVGSPTTEAFFLLEKRGPGLV
jgi:hypothetical protein